MGEVILYISKWKEQPAFDMKLAGIRRYADKCGHGSSSIAINLGILQGRPLPITPCDFCPIGLYMAPNLCYNSIRLSKRKE